MSAPHHFDPALPRVHDAVRQDAERAIHRAAAASKTPFSTLVSIAAAESGFDASAKNRHSSAAGPFQITEKTWIQLVKTYGASAGRPDLAAMVKQDANGLSVAPENRSLVLDARHDLDLSSKLAAKLCDESRTGLAKNLGRQPSEEEVRLAYFLGVKGATRLMTAAEATPTTTMKALLPAAYANHRTMFSSHGKSLTADQALDALQARYTQEIAHSGKVRSYAGTQLLTAPIEDPPAALSSTAVQVAEAPSPEAEAAVPAAETAAATPEPAPQTAEAAPPVQLADATQKDLACTPTKDGVSCAL